MSATFKIGAMVESFRAGLRGGLEAAAAVGAQGVQLYVTRGETRFSKLTGTALSDLKKMLADNNLELAALCGDFGGHGFQVEADNPKLIDDSKRVVDLARELDCRPITTHIGVIPPDPRHPRYTVMAKACAAMAEYAHANGRVFAIETGPETAAVLRHFLDDIDIPTGIGVNFDPANLVMVCRENIPAAVELLGKYIVHTHAKDGVNLKLVDPEVFYGAVPRPAGFKGDEYLREVPLGKGDVPFPAYLEALRKVGYKGYLTIEREVGPDPRKDIAEAVDFLKNLIN